MAETDSRIMPRLGLLSTTQSGSGFPPRLQGQTSKELPFYKVGSLSIVGEDGTINDSRNTISIDEAHELKAAIIPSGSILMAKIGAALLLGRFVQTKFDCCIDNNMLALIPQKGVDPRYLHYATCLINVTHLENPGPIPTLDINGLLQVRIPLPPLPTQRAIADYLNRETAEIDGMRADLDEMERLLTERRRNTIEEALKEAAKHGTIPLGYVATTVAGGTPSTSNSSYWCCDDEEGYPWVTIGDMSSTPVVTTTEKQVTDAGIDAARLSIGEPGTILFAMYGATLGAVSRLGLTASWNQAILGIFPDESVLSPDFLELSLIASKNHLVTLHRGNTQNNLNAEQVKGLRIPLPPFAEQCRIADEIDRETAEIDSMLEDITKLRDLLTERRAAVISAAVTGQIDIPASLDDKDEPHA